MEFHAQTRIGTATQLALLAIAVIARPALADEPKAKPALVAPPTLDVPRTVVTKPGLSSDEIAAVFEGQLLGEAEPAASEDAPNAHGETADSSDPKADAEGPQRWIDQLASPQFAKREQATAALHEVGSAIVPALQRVATEHPDLEVRQRAADIVTGITQGETAGRIDDFLAGRDVPLDGWPIVQRIMGDGTKLRELFVEMFLRHRDVMASLGSTPKERGVAFQAATLRIQRASYLERRSPTAADAVALFLLANDPGLRLSDVDSAILIRLLRMEAANRLHTDATLSTSFNALVGGWMKRSELGLRQEVLWLALSWDMDEALPIAIKTLTETTEPQVLAVAMQSLSRMGQPQHISSLEPFLADTRPASDQQFVGGTLVQAQVGDVAAAAIILIAGKTLADFGLNEAASHPRFGLIVEELGFEVEDTESRAAVREQIKPLLTPDAKPSP